MSTYTTSFVIQMVKHPSLSSHPLARNHQPEQQRL